MDRKIVYIDVGNMPLNKASKKVYDTLDKIRGLPIGTSWRKKFISDILFWAIWGSFASFAILGVWWLCQH